jgi:hypothetical protein
MNRPISILRTKGGGGTKREEEEDEEGRWQF